MNEPTPTKNRTCNLGGWCDGEAQAVATVIIKGTYATYPDATCRKCLIGLLNQSPEAFWVEQDTE